MSNPDRPVGRRPGNPQDTRDDILAAARLLFAENGYERATIRGIAATAEVDPGLVIHHFTNKTALFAAAHALPFDPATMLEHAAELPIEERGREVARIYLSMTDLPGSAAVSLLRGAATNDSAAQMLNEFITSVFLAHADTLMTGPNCRRRLALVGAHLMGVAVARNIVGVGPLSEASVDELVDLMGPSIQQYFDPS